MKAMLVVTAVSMGILQGGVVHAESVTDRDNWPTSSCRGARPFEQSFNIDPASVTRAPDGTYSAVFVVGLSVHWAPPEPSTLEIAVNDGAECVVSLPNGMRWTSLSESLPSTSADCANLQTWIKLTSNPDFGSAPKHSPTVAHFRWDPEPSQWNSGSGACRGGQVNYSIGVTYKHK